MSEQELAEYRRKLDLQRVVVVERENAELRERLRIAEAKIADLQELIRQLPVGRQV
jgi:hypothetical protein